MNFKKGEGQSARGFEILNITSELYTAVEGNRIMRIPYPEDHVLINNVDTTTDWKRKKTRLLLNKSVEKCC